MSTVLTAVLLIGRAQSQSVKIEIEGIVPVSCRLDTAITQVNLGDVRTAGGKSIPFTVRCNTPFKFAISSRDGALTTPHSGPVDLEFTASIPYEAKVQIPTNVGILAGSCPSAMLKGRDTACSFPDSGQGVALSGEASLEVSWGRGNEPIAGTYSDQLDLWVIPKL